MWICPVCGESNETGPLCRSCGFDESLDYKKYRTLEAVRLTGERADIYRLQKESRTVPGEEAFDIFICCRERDESGEKTPDGLLGEELYCQLTKEGFRVFFSGSMLEDERGAGFMPYLLSALDSAKVMVVLGTKPEHFQAAHVKNEWSRFLVQTEKDSGKVLIPVYRDMDPGDLPAEFSGLKPQNMSGLGFMLELIRELRKAAAVGVSREADEKLSESGEYREEGAFKSAKEEKPVGEKRRKRSRTAAAVLAAAICAAAGITVLLQGVGKTEPMTQGAGSDTEIFSAKQESGETMNSPEKENQSSSQMPEVGDTIRFGAYEQDNDSSDGKEDIEWLVLDKKDSRVLVVSRYGLDCQPYHEQYEDVTWETCTLRGWLNGLFLEEAFGEEEQMRICETALTNPDNDRYGTEGGNDTADRIFLLSREEAEQYLPSKEERRALPTEYAKKQGAMADDDGTADWWLRSPGRRQQCAGSVMTGGSFDELTIEADVDFIAVRPAMWIDLNASVMPVEEEATESPEQAAERRLQALQAAEAGDIVCFGTYEQDAHTENGKEEIEWRVLDRQEHALLVISERCLDAQPYHNNSEAVTWETCSLREWLNTTFIGEAFSEEEQMRIAETTIENPDNARGGAEGGNDTEDRVFLLNEAEEKQYFSSDEDRQAVPTEYAKTQGVNIGSDGNTRWWLRSPGPLQNRALGVHSHGGAEDTFGSEVNDGSIAVRPAMWISLEH